MKIDFLNEKCRKVTHEKKFGICDDNNKQPAYIDIENDNNWIATVINDKPKEIVFTAIDNCIDIFRENGEMESRCDVIMSTDNCLYLVELKNKVSDWKSDGIEQLESTILSLRNSATNFFLSFKKRKAYVANKRHPNFHVTKTEDMERFRDKYSVRLDIQAIIHIK